MNTQAIIAAAVESFDLGPEDQDAVLRFWMKLQDMEDAERKPQPPTVEQIIDVVKAHWPPDECPRCDGMGCSGPCAEHHGIIKVRDRLTTLLNTSAAMAEVERHSDECIGQ